ncbi:MAG: hypothetical protein HQ541_09845, partial [Mariniphaga sp.]|nr:hypothetical protein [Mariniphaga sp.]
MDCKRFLFSIILIISVFSTMVSNAQSEALVTEAEAEDGILSGVVVSSDNPGFSGTGYVTGFDNSGDKVSVSMNIPEKGYYKLSIRYNGPNGYKTQSVVVNNSSTTLGFPSSSTFRNIDIGNFLLEKGNNSFSVRYDQGMTDIDKFQLYSVEKHVYEFDTSPVDLNATEATKELYDFLLFQFGHRIISGQTHSNYDLIKNLTGKSPLIRNHDLQHFTEGYPYLWADGGHTFGKHDDGSVDALIEWYNNTEKKGIVAYQWHWHSPTGGEVSTNTFYTNLTTFDIREAVKEGTPEYNLIIRDIDDIAAELKKFQDADVPILWRPLHEAGGGWFWWGAHGAEPCLKLYNILFERLKNHHQIHNLIWVWSTPEESWYPGNDKVDIIGQDSYPGSYNYDPQKDQFDHLYNLTNGKKIIAMTENGAIPDPDDCLNLDAPWSYFMTWNDLTLERNNQLHLINVYNNPNVLTLESDNLKTDNTWRSSLYPDNWKPGFQDEQGRYLHDFSYAGYHQGEKEIPFITNNIVDITQPPYSADNTGTEDVTQIIQDALNTAGSTGGGVVFLPAGKYRIKPQNNLNYSLRISYDNVVLRGVGPDSTFIFNDDNFMRQKDIILVQDDYSSWFTERGSVANISVNLINPTKVIPVESVEGFEVGDEVVVKSDATDNFIKEHGMEGYWTESAIKGVAFLRQIDSIDIDKKLIFIDSPTRYFLKTRDNSKIYHAGNHLKESGIENLSIG